MFIQLISFFSANLYLLIYFFQRAMNIFKLFLLLKNDLFMCLYLFINVTFEIKSLFLHFFSNLILIHRDFVT